MIWVMLHVVSRQWVVEYICPLILMFVRLLVDGIKLSIKLKYQRNATQIPHTDPRYPKSAAAALKL